MKRFFITPKRLSNPTFYQAVKMVKTVNLSTEIIMPKTHQKWFVNGGWLKISPENSYMCLDYMEYGGRKANWENKQEDKENVIPILFKMIIERDLLEHDETVCSILKSANCPKDLITSFIINSFESPKMPSSLIVDYIQSILQNIELEPFQIELLFLKINLLKREGDRDEVKRAFAQHHLEKIPDSVFPQLLQDAINFKRDNYYSDPITELLREALRRGYLITAEPKIKVVAVYPKEVKMEEKKELKADIVKTSPTSYIIKY